MSGTTFTPGPTPNTVRAADGTVLTAPDGWILLPPGDAALTRRVKAAGDHWTVQEKKGRKVFSKGVWAPAATIDRIHAELEVERATASYTKRKQADARRRENAQAEYVEDFFGAVVAFLAFHPNHAESVPLTTKNGTPSRPLHLCPVCLRKLCWNLRVEPVPYLTKLKAFCEQNCLDAESRWYERAIAALAI
jgi:hypothetical protein